MRLGRGVCRKAMKLAVLFVGISFLFSPNAVAAGDALGCNSNYNLEMYNELHQLIKKDSNIALVYNLAKTALCLGKANEGMSHLQKASDSGHIVATYLLGVYYERNQTFNSSEVTNGFENLNNAIHYYKKAAQIIESLSNYPRGATRDMEYIESRSHTSYYVFRTLPGLYFEGYAIAIEDITKGQRVSYTDTLEVLDKIRLTSIMCLERPALSVWKEKRDIIYEAQQIGCRALLSFAEGVYPLEQKRIQRIQSCKVPPRDCSEHKEVLNQIYALANNMFAQMKSAPRIQ
ncbi:MAG: hypothetical protein OXE44_09820 [Nitrospinae bacterium]|nr:hypothetical protein [Nitrospinota bacterium]